MDAPLSFFMVDTSLLAQMVPVNTIPAQP